ncbi:hypothetical protein D910_12161 [Dendroctonus ponderosae]
MFALHLVNFPNHSDCVKVFGFLTAYMERLISQLLADLLGKIRKNRFKFISITEGLHTQARTGNEYLKHCTTTALSQTPDT